MVIKYGLPVLAFIAIVLAVLSVLHTTPPEVDASPPLPPPSSPFAEQIGAAGMVETASENISIGVPVSGLVMKVSVRPGDKLRRGQPLLHLDDRALQAELSLRESTLGLAEVRLARLQNAPRAEEIPPFEARIEEAHGQLADAEIQMKLIESVSDRRAIRIEDLEKRRKNVDIAAARLRETEAALALLKAGSWKQDLQVAEAEVRQARRQVEQTRTDISRLTVTSPIDGKVLQVNIRAGEYATAGASQNLMLIGSDAPSHIRADVDEKDAWRVHRDARAVASIRGNSQQQFPLRFVRIEPYVVPKRNLTGDAAERVDTRVLQILYALPEGSPVYVGQQMDVFIESTGGKN
ncbi:MAG: efflux RND transporter periplasmic adaptor subunit [Acidobacteria bacterium]|nr:efflux RND transporter periplasmic adaptor subunit [Acidobacteriota bacterium]